MVVHHKLWENDSLRFQKSFEYRKLGSETIEQLYREGLLTNIADFLHFAQKEQLFPLERMAEKSPKTSLTA